MNVRRAMCLLAAVSYGQEVASTTTSSASRPTSSTTSSSSTNIAFFQIPSFTDVVSTRTDPRSSIPTGSYASLTGQVSAPTELPIPTSDSTLSTQGNSSTSNSLLIIGGSTTTRSSISTTTTSAPAPTNTQPCNNHPELCSRRYSNITHVAAHNAAMVRANNVFSNQQVPILGQLNDGIRMIQGQVHFVNDTLYNCHSDCDFLNTGTYESTLVTIRQWLEANPYEVLTLLIGNYNFANVSTFEIPFENSGILDYVFLPAVRPMKLDDWPTLGEMILTNNRLVVFMDYEANQDEVPYILDEFSNMWETPFSPVDPSFPCDVQRPPDLAEDAARADLLYLANHNLNADISFAAFGIDSILVPNFPALPLTNANNDSTGSLLTMATDCAVQWGRPPNFLLVDFYDVGDGSVFEVAAAMNNVTYDRDCCGRATGIEDVATLGPLSARTSSLIALLVAVLVVFCS